MSPSRFQSNQPHVLGKSYEPATFEKDIYQFWEEGKCFEASDVNHEGQSMFSMVIPPPNVTGVLHMGHALTNTIQDILIRWHRMKGDNTLWLPGTDHAGIATQAQVEKTIAKEKMPNGKPKTRHDVGRDAFVELVWKWKEEHGSQITQQLKRLGSSLDWRRERFTMDEGLSAAVREVFVQLYEEGLIYRGERIINWCCRCQTALSDLEVIPHDRKGHLWHIVYKIVNENGTPVFNPDGTEAQLIVATTRPETLLGDTAVAVHPEDDRYFSFSGKKARLPLLNRLIPIIQDEHVDRTFGTGALKVTPAHDFNDYDIGRRHASPHGLPIVSVMGKDGRITSAGGPYAGLKFLDAREKILQDLRESHLLIKVEDHLNKVGLCQRCDSIAEPIISKQWFVKIAPLAKPAITAVEEGKITFTPKSWEKTYFEWMYNIRDWCISRQLWWGHQIPAWYCGQCQEITVSRKSPEKCSHCSASAIELRQDEDVLDTWFSSALWPFSTLGWPHKTQALKTFYPTSILETGFDIIFFWVARMIMMGIHFMGEVPFRKVYLHAMVRDEKGEKMSKSKGNVIDPVLLIEQHGADPLRFTLAAMAGQGRDIKLSIDRVEGYRAFCNKIWNATKYLHFQLDAVRTAGGTPQPPTEGIARWLEKNKTELVAPNRWILSRLQSVIQTVERSLQEFQLDEAAKTLYEFTWRELCDWYIEFSKLPIKEGEMQCLQTLYTLHYSLETLLKLMHPFIPFVTEELWHSLPWRSTGKTLMLEPFPTPNATLINSDSERVIHALQNVVEAIRNFRGENNISPKTSFPIYFIPGSTPADLFIRTYLNEIKTLSRVSEIVKITPNPNDQHTDVDAIISIANPPLEIRIPLKGLVDITEETKRVNKEIEKVNADLAHVRKKLTQETFLSKAPPGLVEAERHNEKEFLQKLDKLQASLRRLAKLGDLTKS